MAGGGGQRTRGCDWCSVMSTIRASATGVQRWCAGCVREDEQDDPLRREGVGETGRGEVPEHPESLRVPEGGVKGAWGA